jgi:hypothetical protein
MEQLFQQPTYINLVDTIKTRFTDIGFEPVQIKDIYYFLAADLSFSLLGQGENGRDYIAMGEFLLWINRIDKFFDSTTDVALLGKVNDSYQQITIENLDLDSNPDVNSIHLIFTDAMSSFLKNDDISIKSNLMNSVKSFMQSMFDEKDILMKYKAGDLSFEEYLSVFKHSSGADILLWSTFLTKSIKLPELTPIYISLLNEALEICRLANDFVSLDTEKKEDTVSAIHVISKNEGISLVEAQGKVRVLALDKIEIFNKSITEDQSLQVDFTQVLKNILDWYLKFYRL